MEKHKLLSKNLKLVKIDAYALLQTQITLQNILSGSIVQFLHFQNFHLIIRVFSQ